VAYKHAIQLRK